MKSNENISCNTNDSADILNRAIIFATQAHRGAFRKGTSIPYILHPLEAASIVEGA